MSKFDFTYKSLFKIGADAVGTSADFDLETLAELDSGILDRIESLMFSPKALKSILTETKYLDETELSVLYYVYEEDMSFRDIAKLVDYSHTKVRQILLDSLVRLKELSKFFTSNKDQEMISIDRLVDKKLGYDRSLTDVVVDHDIDKLYERKILPSCFNFVDRDMVNKSICLSIDLSEDEIKIRRDEIERRLGMKDRLSEEFLDRVTNYVADDIDFDNLRVLGPLDADELDIEVALKDDRRTGSLLLRSIHALEDTLGKRVNIIISKESKEV